MRTVISILLPLQVVFSCNSFAAPIDSVHLNKTNWTFFLSGGRSIFLTNVLPSQSRYPTPEFKVGFAMEFPLMKSLRLSFRPAYGIKGKSQIQNVLTPFNFLEEATNNEFDYVEISSLTGLSFKRLIFKVGLSSRFFFQSSDTRTGILGSKFDIGLPMGISVRLRDKLKLGFEHTLGLVNVYSVAYYDSSIQPQNGILKIKNQQFQFNIEYILNDLFNSN